MSSRFEPAVYLVSIRRWSSSIKRSSLSVRCSRVSTFMCCPISCISPSSESAGLFVAAAPGQTFLSESTHSAFALLRGASLRPALVTFRVCCVFGSAGPSFLGLTGLVTAPKMAYARTADKRSVTSSILCAGSCCPPCWLQRSSPAACASTSNAGRLPDPELTPRVAYSARPPLLHSFPSRGAYVLPKLIAARHAADTG